MKVRGAALAHVFALLFQITLAPAAAAQPPRAARLAEATKLGERESVLFDQRRYGEAVALAERVLAIREEILGANDADVGSSLNALAKAVKGEGDYARAEMLYARALPIMTHAFGAESAQVAEIMRGLGGVLRYKGDFAQAEVLLSQSIDIYSKIPGPEGPGQADALNSLANLVSDQGDFARGVGLYTRALVINERVWGPDSIRVADILNNLGVTYDDLGDYDRARELYERSLVIREKVLGPDHLDVTESLTNIGVLYEKEGDHGRAETYFVQALAILRRVHGPEQEIAKMLLNLAEVAAARDEFTHADGLFQQAIAGFEKALGPNHPSVAFPLFGFARSSRRQAKFDQAELLLGRALRIREQALGPDHPEVADTLAEEAELLEAKGDMEGALQARRKSSDARERHTVRILWSGSEEQKRKFLALTGEETDSAIAFALRTGRPDAASLALTAVLRRKGRVLDELAENILSLRRGLDAEGAKLFDDLASVRSNLAKKTLAGEGDDGNEAYTRELGSLAIREGELEAAIGAKSTAFKQADRPLTSEAVQACLPEHAALAEWFVYSPRGAEKMRNDEEVQKRVAVALLRRTGSPIWIDLGDAASIDADVAVLRGKLSDPLSDVLPAARALELKAFAPIRARLGEVREVFLSPDGALDLVPFGALVDNDGRYLIERWSLVYLTSGRDLLGLAVREPSREPVLVVGDPAFGSAGSSIESDAGTHGLRSMDMGQVMFRNLPGTEAEVRAIAAAFPGSRLLVRNEATEGAIKGLHGPRILHVATHGFFLAMRPRSKLRGDAEFASAENPLLRAGVALAGANARRSANEDGILTALEASSLDLRGTKLVTLSACETGVGKTMNGEGIYGLRRALVLAGAESQMVSLWKLDDDVTSSFMAEYYRRIAADGGRAEALREVQLAQLGSRKRAHPFYWAPFLLSGDPGTLNGTHAPPALPRRSLWSCGCNLALRGKGDESMPSVAICLAILCAGARKRGTTDKKSRLEG